MKLTIDDVPSADFPSKLEFLIKREINATFYCVGEKMEKQIDIMKEAIKHGYSIGNHSYSHPRFSNISTYESLKEINQTDLIIDNLHKETNTKRNKKFRFPYFDDANGKYDYYLRKMRYNIENYCTFDVLDWAVGRAEISYAPKDEGELFKRITNKKFTEKDIILIHDHEKTKDIFCKAIEMICGKTPYI